MGYVMIGKKYIIILGIKIVIAVIFAFSLCSTIQFGYISLTKATQYKEESGKNPIIYFLLSLMITLLSIFAFIIAN